MDVQTTESKTKTLTAITAAVWMACALALPITHK